jgi:hypothetical protein
LTVREQERRRLRLAFGSRNVVEVRAQSVKNSLKPAEISGEPPSIEGRRCEGFLCQELWSAGALVEQVNVIYLKFGGAWSRLYFDHGFVFWRQDIPEGPPIIDLTECGDIRLVNIAERDGLIGQELVELTMGSVADASEVSFEFSNGKGILIRARYDDQAEWQSV